MNRSSRFFIGLVGLLCFASAAYPQTSDTKHPSDRGLEWFSIEEYLSHFQTHEGSHVTFPELALKAAFNINPRWKVDLRYFRGKSSLVNNFSASVGDFEGRLEYRLDDPKTAFRGDSPFQNIYGWTSWKIWTSTDYFNGVNFRERDEGAGFGFSRYPKKHGLSYQYSFSFYPSVRTPVAQEGAAILADVGGIYAFDDETGYLTFGYRLQTLQTGKDPHARAEEQGVIFGLRSAF